MLFLTIGCILGLWLLCKWGDRDTKFFKSQMTLKNEYELKIMVLKQQLDAGHITQDEYDKLQTEAFDRYLDEDFVNTVRNTQIGFKDYRKDDYRKR